MTAKHLFISYSRKDRTFVDRLVESLESHGMTVWLDTDDLVPGTPNWEQAIRDAIEYCTAVLLVASPHSRASVYVQGELTLAQLRQKPIYPLWADGKHWVDAVQLGMVNTQYLDFRPDAFENSMADLIKIMSRLTDESRGQIILSLPTYETIELNLAAFKDLFGAANHIYMKHLLDWYPMLTYGTEWVLGNVRTRQLAIPPEWLTIALDDEKAIREIYLNWGMKSLADIGITANGHWGVWEVSRIKPIVVCTNQQHVMDALLTDYSLVDPWLLHDEGCLRVKPLQEVNFKDYQYQCVFAVFNTTRSRVAFIDTDKPCTF
ncbi:MAG: hypothetical protein OHK0046_08950 [Anaerolineae bacterium]